MFSCFSFANGKSKYYYLPNSKIYALPLDRCKVKINQILYHAFKELEIIEKLVDNYFKLNHTCDEKR